MLHSLSGRPGHGHKGSRLRTVQRGDRPLVDHACRPARKRHLIDREHRCVRRRAPRRRRAPCSEVEARGLARRAQPREQPQPSAGARGGGLSDSPSGTCRREAAAGAGACRRGGAVAARCAFVAREREAREVEGGDGASALGAGREPVLGRARARAPGVSGWGGKSGSDAPPLPVLTGQVSSLPSY